MNKLKYGILLGMIALGFSSCLKDNQFQDLSNTQPIIEFAQGSDGTSALSWGSQTGTIDTAIAFDIASPQVLTYDVTVTIKYDQSLITKWNAANPTNTVQALPDSIGTFPATATFKIPAGYRVGRIPVKLDFDKLNPTVSYCMPFSLVSATGPSGQNLLVSTNAGALLYNFIGNPIAGNYTQEYIRYNSATQTGTPVADQTLTGTFVPVTPTEITVTSGIGAIYTIDFDDNAGVLSNFKIKIDVSPIGVTLSGGPTIVTADPINGIYEFNWQYTNASGAARNITDKFHK
jgi:hypothetical protein